jgi:hypothetical protein
MIIAKRFLIASVMLVGVSSAVFAQVSPPVVPFTVEGKLTYVDISFIGNSIDPKSSIKCNGSTIYLSDATVISTPTNIITAPLLISDRVLPGRALIPPADAPAPSTAQRSVFMGGTCIVEGEDNQMPGGRMASTLFVEPAENVLVGPTTNEPGKPFEILGVRIKLMSPPPNPLNGENLANYLPDPMGRIVARSPTNANGFKIKLNTVAKGDESSAEGYLSDDRKTFHAFAIETTGGTPIVPPGTPAAAILRADVTFVSATRVKLEVRGGCTAFPQQVAFELLDAAIPPNVIATDVTTCTDGTYRYRDDQFATSAARPVPTSVRASVNNGGYVTDDIVLERIGF